MCPTSWARQPQVGGGKSREGRRNRNLPWYDSHQTGSHTLVIPEIDAELISYLQSRFPLSVRPTLDDSMRQEGRHEVKGAARVIALQPCTTEVSGCERTPRLVLA